MPTTIQIKKQTLERLQNQKYSLRQSYDEVEDDTLTTEEIEYLQLALEQVKKRQVHSIESVAEELGIQL